VDRAVEVLTVEEGPAAKADQKDILVEFGGHSVDVDELHRALRASDRRAGSACRAMGEKIEPRSLVETTWRAGDAAVSSPAGGRSAAARPSSYFGPKAAFAA
jgi:hypothetical protein